MLSITDNFLYVIDSEGRQQLFDADKLKVALTEAFEASGNPNGYLAEDIACAVESAMMESLRSDRIFTQSEVDAAVNRILENAGCANVAQVFRRANSHLYITLDASVNDTQMLISRHLGIEEPFAGKLAGQVVDALKQLNINSASPALYLELARHYEHNSGVKLSADHGSVAAAAGQGSSDRTNKILLTSAQASDLMPQSGNYLLEKKIIKLSNVSKLYPNFRLTLDLSALCSSLQLSAPVTDLQLAPALYSAGEKVGVWLNLLCNHLGNDQIPLYLVLNDLDLFTRNYLGSDYPAGRVNALEIAGLFRNALGYPVKKVRCRTAPTGRNNNAN